MKKKLALVLAGLLTLGAIGCGNTAAPAPETTTTEAQTETKTEEAKTEEPQAQETDALAELVEAAKAEGELIVYGSCEEEYLAAACENFESMYGS